MDGPQARHPFLRGFREAHVEAGVIYRDERVGFRRFDFGEHPVELAPEVSVFLEDIPEAHNGFVGPVEDRASRR